MSIEISDEAVEAAKAAYYWAAPGVPAMRAALAAALPLIVGEPVGWAHMNYMPWLSEGVISFTANPGDVTSDHIPLYAIKQGASRE